MSYATAVEHLYALAGELAAPKPGAPRRKFELAHMRTLAAALGNPQDRFPSVLIAGTNGKGSTSATLASIFATAGYKTGLYTSPHLLRVNERIQTSSATSSANTLADIDDDTFARLYFQVDDAGNRLVAENKLPHPPSFFEAVTAVAFLAFAEARVDIAILEVGLGGRLDATNIVSPLLSVITDIALDHTEWLGPTITDIAREKAGILRPGGKLITLPQHQEANAAIGEQAVALDVTGVNAAAYLPDRAPQQHTYALRVMDTTITVDSPLRGEHQRRNIALAIAAATELAPRFHNITAAAVEHGIRNTHWPGRLELSHTIAGTPVLLDVAHNPAGVWTLRSYLSRAFETNELPAPHTLVFSALRDKAIQEMAQILFPLFEEPGDRILMAPVNNPRTASAQDLDTLATTLETAAEVFDTGDGAMIIAMDSPGSIIVAGSVYLVAEAKAWLARAQSKYDAESASNAESK